MSIEIQKQIKENSTDVSSYLSDLVKWTEDQGKQERRRDIRKTSEKQGVQEAKRLAEATKPTPVKEDKEEQEVEGSEKPIKRDKNPMPQYYNDWDRYDPEGEVDKIEDEAFKEQRAEFLARQAEKDRILDEMALKADGDRTRTSTARPRVKISVRRGGRKVAPVDLAMPRKEEANRLFSAGRYREALNSYSAALDCLDKYEPPGEKESKEPGDGPKDGDDAGQETEAVALKVALLANRALAFLKLEEWRECVVDCSEALRFDAEHHKATLRRGFAMARMKRWGLASKDLQQALIGDPADKKAAAELQMVKRMLAEQAKEARAHAKCVMVDPTRFPVMPTRRLVCKVRRGDSMSMEAVAEEATKPKPADEASVSADKSNGAPATAQRSPYVPRSVRMRGAVKREEVGYPASGGATGSSARSAKPSAVNFYQFEAQWARLRNKPNERAALLRKIGAGALPALFRESFDSELLASIAEAVSSDLAAEGAAKFAVDTLDALSRTQRFDLSLQSLTADERQNLSEVLNILSMSSGINQDQLEAVRVNYAPPQSSKEELQELDEDDIPEDAPRVPAEVQEAMSSNFDEKVASGPAVVAAASFSLDGCD